MWLSTKNVADAKYYWSQAKNFYLSSIDLPIESRPLPLYYSFMNAAKCLLALKRIQSAAKHGISGRTSKSRGKFALTKEIVKFETSGVFPALSNFLGDNDSATERSLYCLLSNLPFIHRSFTITYPSYKEMFIPVSNPMFVRKHNSSEAWFSCELSDNYATKTIIKTLKTIGFETEKRSSSADKKSRIVIRRGDRFKWVYKKQSTENLKRLATYHKKIRKNLELINGESTLWYIKRKCDTYVERHQLTLILSSMHRLSELVRYSPLEMKKHLESRENWLISEFVETAAEVFIDLISSEITGRNFLPPLIKKRTI